MVEIKDGEDRDAAGVAFAQPLDPDQLPRHLAEREAFTAADSYVSSDLETNTAATPTASMSKQGLERDHVYSSRGGGNFDE